MTTQNRRELDLHFFDALGVTTSERDVDHTSRQRPRLAGASNVPKLSRGNRRCHALAIDDDYL